MHSERDSLLQAVMANAKRHQLQIGFQRRQDHCESAISPARQRLSGPLIGRDLRELVLDAETNLPHTHPGVLPEQIVWTAVAHPASL